MAIGPIDYGSMLTQLDVTPLLQGLQVRQARKAAEAQQTNWEMQRGLEREKFTAAQDEDKAYNAAVANVAAHPTFENMAGLQMRFPKHIEATRTAWGTYDAGMQKRNMSFMTGLHGLITSGNVRGAIELAERRKLSLESTTSSHPDAVTAFNPEGSVSTPINTNETDMILSLLKSGDPKQIDTARGLAFYGIGIAAGPDKFADIIKSVGGEADYTLSPGSKRYDRDNNLVASADFAPDRFTLSPGETRYETPGSGLSAGARGASVDNMFNSMIKLESGGRQFAEGGGSLRSPKGAVGAAQLMPKTAPEAAGLAGVRWDPDRFHNDRDYNVKLGRAYFQKQLDDFGDPAKAAAAYNAGPGRTRAAIRRGGDNWLSMMPAETQSYVAQVTGGGQGGPPDAGGARVTATAGPKPADPQGKRMTPAEVQQEGLDPATVYYRNKDGVPVPVAGQTKTKAGDQGYSQSALDSFDRAIGSAQRLLKHDGFSASVGAKGVTGGLLGGWVVPGTDAADFNAELGALKAQVFLPMVQSMKGMGALSNAEGEKLTAAIGALDPTMSESGFKASLNRVIGDLQEYRKRAASKGAPATPGPKPQSSAVQRLSPAEAAKLPPGTRFIGQDGRARVRQ